MFLDNFIRESFLNDKIYIFRDKQAHDSFDLFPKDNDADHSDLSFIHEIDNFCIIHHYEDTSALLLSDAKKGKIGVKQILSSENKQAQIEEDKPEII
jgi:hypothetical protein